MDRCLFDFALRMGDTTLILSAAAVRLVRPRAHPGRGPGADQHGAGPAGPGAPVADAGGRGRRRRPRRRPAGLSARCARVPQCAAGGAAQRQTTPTPWRGSFFFDAWHYFLLERLAASSEPRVATIAAKAVKEAAYHARRSARSRGAPGRRHGGKPCPHAGGGGRRMALLRASSSSDDRRR